MRRDAGSGRCSSDAQTGAGVLGALQQGRKHLQLQASQQVLQWQVVLPTAVCKALQSRRSSGQLHASGPSQ